MTTYIGQPADQYRFIPPPIRKTASLPPIAPPPYSALKGLTLTTNWGDYL